MKSDENNSVHVRSSPQCQEQPLGLAEIVRPSTRLNSVGDCKESSVNNHREGKAESPLSTIRDTGIWLATYPTFLRGIFPRPGADSIWTPERPGVVKP